MFLFGFVFILRGRISVKVFLHSDFSCLKVPFSSDFPSFAQALLPLIVNLILYSFISVIKTCNLILQGEMRDINQPVQSKRVKTQNWNLQVRKMRTWKSPQFVGSIDFWQL